MKFDMGDMVFVRVALYHYMMRLEQKSQLALRFIRPFKILEYVSKVVYWFTLPMSMDQFIMCHYCVSTSIT